MPKIIIADDHAVVREGLRTLIDCEPDLEVIEEAGSGIEAVRKCDRLKPDILVLDVMMGDINGMEVIRQIKELSPDTAVIILSMYEDEWHISEAIKLGASAYISKKTVSEDLIEKIRQIYKELSSYDGSGVNSEDTAADSPAEPSSQDPYESLSAREREVLQMAANGLSRVEISRRLNISHRTVEDHRARAMHKLNLKSRADLLRYAIKRGILPTELE